MADQTSFRLPADMLRDLAQAAKQRGVPKSQLVREALELYLANANPPESRELSVRDRSAPYIGAIVLAGPGDSEDIAVRIRRRNWRT